MSAGRRDMRRLRSKKRKNSEASDGPLEEDAAVKDFFDLAPAEIANHKTPGAIVARRKPRDLKRALKALAGLLVLGGVITAVVLLWPSSQVRVPDLVGKSLSEAMEKARDSGFSPTVTAWKYSQKRSDGVVLEQSPAGEKVVRKGTSIALTVSKGARQEESTPTGEAEVPDQTLTGGSTESPGPLADKVVTIDPCHQALPALEEYTDPGMTRRVPGDKSAKGVVTKNEEYTVTLDIGMKLKNLLEKDGVQIVMTRETSTVDLTDVIRAEIANNAGSDLFVRVNCATSTDEFMMGMDTLYPAKSRWSEPIYEKSKTAALFIQSEMLKSCGMEDLGVLERHDLPGFNWSRVPVTMAEVGFLSNPRDDSLLADDQFRWKVAWGLRNGIVKYLGSP